MPHTVEVPEIGTIDFPEDMTEEQIGNVLRQKFPPAGPRVTGFDLTAGGRLLPGGQKAPSGMEAGTEFTEALYGRWKEPLAKLLPDIPGPLRRSMISQGTPKDQRLLGTYEGIQQTVNALTSPENIALLVGTGGAGGAVSKLIGAGFAIHMGKTVSQDIAEELGREYAKPEAERDQVKIGQLISNGLAQTALASTIGAKSLAPTAKGTLPDASQIRETAPVYGAVRPQPIEGVREVPIQEGGAGVQPRPEALPQLQEKVVGSEEQVAEAAQFGRELAQQLTPEVAKTPQEALEPAAGAPAPPLEQTASGSRIDAKTTRLLKERGLNDSDIFDLENGNASVSQVVNRKLPSQERGPEHAIALEEARIQAVGEIESILKSAKIESVSKYEEIGPGKETEMESRFGTASGLPPGIPDRGPNFPVELLEASRRLGTLVRSKVDLPQNILGRYKRASIAQDDRIEVGDIRNQATVSHEMGHDLDALLFPNQNLGNSQASLGLRVGANGKDLANELLPVSELMRGPISGSAGHQAYRKRATELIADYFSLYSHDPVRAKQMAPKFTKSFEDALATNPDAAETIRQLHAGNVEPVAPQALQPPTGAATEMPGQVPARPTPTPIPRDRELAIAAEDLVKGQIRKFESEVQGARIKSDTWRERVPDQKDRNDVGGFVEGIGNLEIPGDTIDALKARMTPEKKDLAKQYRFNIELQRQRINEYLKGSTAGEYLNFLEDYLPHFYVNSKSPAGIEAIARFRKESPNAKARKIPTLREAVDYGLKPISQDPAVLYETTARINWRVATNRELLSKLKGMQSGGQPIIQPVSQAPPGWPKSNNPLIERVYAQQTPQGTMLWRGGAAIHPDAWRAVRMMLETPTSSSIGKAYDAINGLTRANAFAFSLFHDLTLRSASLGEQMKWYNPVRGLFRLFERNPKTGELEIFRSTRGLGKELMKDEATVTDAALHGLKFSWTESESYQHAARNLLDKAAVQWRDVPYLGKSIRLARDIQNWRQEGLWKNTHDALKVMAYQDLTAKALQEAPPEFPASKIKENIASRLNDTFGGQEWQTKFWMSPQVRQTLARFWLAPDWTLSTLRSVPFVSDIFSVTRGQLPRLAGLEPIPTRGEGLHAETVTQTATGQHRFTYNNPTYGGIQRAKFWGAEIAALAMATVAAQYAIYHAFGDKNKGDKEWVWENEKGQNRRIDVTPLVRELPWHKKDDPTRYYVNLGKRPEEIIGWVVHPEQNTMSKMARPVAEVFRQITGTEGDFKAEWKRDHEAFIESLPSRAKSVAGTLIPFTFSGNQFALSLPYRKGMTKYKAEQAYESAYELMAEPNKFKSVVREQTTDLDKLVGQISDAAERNGVPSEIVRKRALSITRGKYYDQYFKALQKNDKKGMEKAADALGRLGATSRGLDQSIRGKMAVEPQMP